VLARAARSAVASVACGPVRTTARSTRRACTLRRGSLPAAVNRASRAGRHASKVAARLRGSIVEAPRATPVLGRRSCSMSPPGSRRWGPTVVQQLRVGAPIQEIATSWRWKRRPPTTDPHGVTGLPPPGRQFHDRCRTPQPPWPVCRTRSTPSGPAPRPSIQRATPTLLRGREKIDPHGVPTSAPQGSRREAPHSGQCPGGRLTSPVGPTSNGADPHRSEDRAPHAVYRGVTGSVGGVVSVLDGLVDAAAVGNLVAVLLGPGPDFRGVRVTARSA
jgi:hypothetical protein